MMPESIVNWFAGSYRAVGVSGCSSHSGRRTFITQAARLVHKAAGSLRLGMAPSSPPKLPFLRSTKYAKIMNGAVSGCDQLRCLLRL
jgi:hypothetical protein